RAGARCGPGLVCASRAAGAAPEGTGLCVCAQRGSVCGSDGRSYPSVCALRLRARQAPRALPGRLHKARDGPCEFECGKQGVPTGVKNLPAKWETWVRSLGWEDSPGEGNNYPLQYSCGGRPLEISSKYYLSPRIP
ncbi:hypothetical protein FD755_025887, partial [Muntiacus reevesi]